MPAKKYEFIIGSRALAQYRDYALKRLDMNAYQEKSMIGRIMIDGGAVSTYFHSTIPRGVDFSRDRVELMRTVKSIEILGGRCKKQWMAVLIDKVFIPKNSQFGLDKKANLIGVKPENFNKLVSRGVCFIGSCIIALDTCHKNV